MPDKLSISEAKRNFADAMDRISLSELVRDHPFGCFCLSAAAGAFVGLSGKRVSRLVFPILELIGWASRFLSK